MGLDLIDREREVAAQVASASRVVPTGSGTHHEVGGAPLDGEAVHAPSGIVTYDPAELTVTLGAGTTVSELRAVLGESGQECALDPRDDGATVGGTLACGLSGVRRLRYGPVRDRVLEVRFATATGELVRGGGPTVKNVTGYDIPRLLVGSFGTLGVLTRVILRCQPTPLLSAWSATDDDPEAVLRRCFRPSAVLWDGSVTRVLHEGHPDDVGRQQREIGLEVIAGEPVLPSGPHRGRASVSPARITELGGALDAVPGTTWLAEIGVGTVHVACDTEASLRDARTAAETAGGWLLREAGAPGLDGFGIALPNLALMARMKEAFDPTGKLAPGRLPIAVAAREAAPA